MAPVKKTSLTGGKETLRHFTHPHVLIKELTLDLAVYSTNRFGCDGCGMDGCGVRYHCKQCSFDLHEECATCPEYFTSNIHLHELQRIWEEPEEDYDHLLRPCNVCGDQVKGLFYKCSSGADEKSYDDEEHYFFIHPTCSTLPSEVVLKLQSVPIIPDAPCAVCRDIISSSSWSYRSDSPCSLNIHPQCVTLPHDNHQAAGSGSASRSALQQVEDAAADEEELAAVMYAAKMRAKTNKFIINNIR